MKLRLHATEKEVTALGTGRRYAVWVQGCERRCKGCMSPETWERLGGYEDDSERLAEEIVSTECEGITISGGEPFLQAEALADLVIRVREKKDLGVIIYTGNTYEELLDKEEMAIHQLLSLCDLLIDGTYQEELNDGKNLRGSSNQKVIALSERYQKEKEEYGTKPASVEFFVHETMTRMVGIPSRTWMERVKKIQW